MLGAAGKPGLAEMPTHVKSYSAPVFPFCHQRTFSSRTRLSSFKTARVLNKRAGGLPCDFPFSPRFPGHLDLFDAHHLIKEQLNNHAITQIDRVEFFDRGVFLLLVGRRQVYRCRRLDIMGIF